MADSTHGAKGWTLLILAVPVLYVLTFPPMLILALRRAGGAPSQWIIGYAMPYAALSRTRPLTDPLEKYSRWWNQVYVDWEDRRNRQKIEASRR